MDWYLKRIDIRRNYIADSTIDPLQDLKNGFGEMDLGLYLINSHYVTNKIGPKA